MMALILAWALASGLVAFAWMVIGCELERRKREQENHDRQMQRRLDALYSRSEEAEL